MPLPKYYNKVGRLHWMLIEISTLLVRGGRERLSEEEIDRGVELLKEIERNVIKKIFL